MKPDKLTRLFARGHWIIKSQTDGLSHDDSMLQLPFWDNNLNWVLGHVIHYRDQALQTLGEPALLSQKESDTYARESRPLKDAGDGVALSRLLELADETQGRLETILERVRPEQFAAVYNEESGQTVGERIEFIQWHETYHLGQMEILRQLAGKNDSII